MHCRINYSVKINANSILLGEEVIPSQKNLGNSLKGKTLFSPVQILLSKSSPSRRKTSMSRKQTGSQNIPPFKGDDVKASRYIKSPSYYCLCNTNTC